MKIIFAVLDTLRADHLGCYGYARPTSPRLDALAKEGALFERAYATDVPTQPSYTAMFTGMRGIRSGVVSHSPTETIADTVPWLPQRLAENGYETAAVSTLCIMKKYFTRGYHTYMNPVAHDRAQIQQVTAEQINAYAIPWLRANKDRDLFLFLHYWDPHSLYNPPHKRYRTMFYDGDPCDPKNHSLDELRDQLIGPFTMGHLEKVMPGVTDKQYVVAQYDGEIRYLDDQFTILLDTLTSLGIEDDTLLIVTADHGESMGEHALYFDHCGVYEPTVRVPLLVRWPGCVPPGTRVNALVQGIDIPATILAAAGVEAPETFQGRNLTPLATGEQKAAYEFVVSNQGLWQAKRMISDGTWKLINALDNGLWPAPARELYNIEDDPSETRNVVETQPDIAARLDLQLRRWEDAQLRGGIDPLRKIVQSGLPSRAWVEQARIQKGLTLSYEEVRNLIDVPFTD